jgi:hypothetical protein
LTGYVVAIFRSASQRGGRLIPNLQKYPEKPQTSAKAYLTNPHNRATYLPKQQATRPRSNSKLSGHINRLYSIEGCILQSSVAIIIKVGGFVKKAVPTGGTNLLLTEMASNVILILQLPISFKAHQDQHFNAIVVTDPGVVETTGKFNSKKGA